MDITDKEKLELLIKIAKETDYAALFLYNKECEEFKKSMEPPSIVIQKGAACGQSIFSPNLVDLFNLEKSVKQMQTETVLQQHIDQQVQIQRRILARDPLTEEESEAIRNQPTCHNCGSIEFLHTGTCPTCAVCGESQGACG